MTTNAENNQTDLIDPVGSHAAGREFHVRITEGGRVTLDLTMDAELRVVRAFAIDDDRLREMLIVSSVVAGTVEGVCMRAPKDTKSSTEGRAEA